MNIYQPPIAINIILFILLIFVFKKQNIIEKIRSIFKKEIKSKIFVVILRIGIPCLVTEANPDKDGFQVVNKFKYFINWDRKVLINDIYYIQYYEGIVEAINPIPSTEIFLFSQELLYALENRQIQELRAAEKIFLLEKVIQKMDMIFLGVIIIILICLKLNGDITNLTNYINAQIPKILTKFGLPL